MADMEYASVVGLEKPVSRLIFGTAIRSMLGGDDVSELLDAALEAGINTFDTARGYGMSEKSLGNWIGRRQNREQVVLITKGCNVGPLGQCRVSRKTVLQEMDESLKTLGTDYVDIYLLHRDNPKLPVEDLVEVLNELKRDGKCRIFGVSNWSWQRIDEANRYARSRGLSPIAVSSPHFGLAEQVQDPWGGGCVSLTGLDQAEARSWYRETGLPVLAYSSLAGGLFSGKFSSGDHTGVRKGLSGAARKGYFSDENLERLRRTEILSREMGVPVSQIALAWLLRYPGLSTFAITSASSGERVRENVGALSVSLTEEQHQWLNLERDAL